MKCSTGAKPLVTETLFRGNTCAKEAEKQPSFDTYKTLLWIFLLRSVCTLPLEEERRLVYETFGKE